MLAAVEPPKRNFVPQKLDLSDWSQIEPLYQSLLARPIRSKAELERCLLDLSELTSVVDEHSNRLYINKSCHTDDLAIERAFMDYVENIEPRIKPLLFALQKKLIESPHRAEMTGVRYGMLIRQWRAEVEVYRDENVPLETEQTKLVNEYDKLCGLMMVQFREQERTLQQLARFQEEPDRKTREEAWQLGKNRRLQDREAIEQIFEKLLPLRHQLAVNAGTSDYRAYMWKSLKRFDYTPEDCVRFADTIEKNVVPLVDELDRQRAADLKLEKLRPWDFAVDPLSRPPLRPFGESDSETLVRGTYEIFKRMSAQLADDFDSLRRNKNLDLASRKGKQPGGYQSTLCEVRQPFIFMNAAGLQRDVETLLHEGGHAFHTLAANDEPIVFLRHAPMEFCEVASMSMELLGAEHLDLFYNEQDHARARRVHLEGIIRLFPWTATIDMFQHWLYTHPGHSRQQRKDYWLELARRFGSKIDWSGIEGGLEASWQRQLHLFHVPFYYVEYAIAQLGALQVWLKAKEDPQRALSSYRAGLKLGGTRPLPELFSAAGIRFDFSQQTIGPLMNAIRDELAELPR